MKYFVVLLVLVLVALCLVFERRPQEIARWEYRTVKVDNEDDEVLTRAIIGRTADKYLVAGLSSGAGSFDLYGVTNAENLDAIGKQGWELVSAVPQIETLTNTEGPPNTRTRAIFLIFKRPR